VKKLRFGWNIESFIYIISILVSIPIIITIIRKDWKRYGFLFLLSALAANVFCFIFIYLDLYVFPFRVVPEITPMPIGFVSTVFPSIVLLTVYYSPEPWPWKIPFYWTIIHIGMFIETYIVSQTKIIKYKFKWDIWDSYTWWWIFFLLFEWIGGLVIPKSKRNPIKVKWLTFGKLGWALIHFVLIITIFLAGYYLGSMK